MGQYPKQCTERLDGPRYIEYIPAHPDRGAERWRSKVFCELEAYQDRWEDAIFGPKGFIGSIKFSSVSEMKCFLGVGRCVLLDGERLLQLALIEGDPGGEQSVRVGSHTSAAVA